MGKNNNHLRFNHARAVAIELMEQVNDITAHFPEEENGRLVPKMRRTANEIFEQIEESRVTDVGLNPVNHLKASIRSCVDLENHAAHAKWLDILSKEQQSKLRYHLNSVKQMTESLINHL